MSNNCRTGEEGMQTTAVCDDSCISGNQWLGKTFSQHTPLSDSKFGYILTVVLCRGLWRDLVSCLEAMFVKAQN